MKITAFHALLLSLITVSTAFAGGDRPPAPSENLPLPHPASLQTLLEYYLPSNSQLDSPSIAYKCINGLSTEMLKQVQTQAAQQGLQLVDLGEPKLHETFSRSQDATESPIFRDQISGDVTGGTIFFSLEYNGYLANRWRRRQPVTITLQFGATTQTLERFTLVKKSENGKKGEAIRSSHLNYKTSIWMPSVSAFKFILPKGYRTDNFPLNDNDEVYRTHHLCDAEGPVQSETVTTYPTCLESKCGCPADPDVSCHE